MIEAAGIQFVAEKDQLSLVAGLHLGVEQRYGRNVLVLSNSSWGSDGGC